MSDPFLDIAPFDPRTARVQRELNRSEHADDRSRPEFRPMEDLPQPEPQPGFTHRYIRVSHGNVADTRNMARRLYEGWTPCTPEEQPKIARLMGRHGVNADGNIEIGGLMLCKIATEIADARNNYYANKSRDQVVAVNNAYLRDHNPKMPKLAPESSTTVSTGHRPT